MSTSFFQRNSDQKLSCNGCQCIIRDKFYLQTEDIVWHNSCLKCQICEHLLDGTKTCYTRDGIFYCQQDYFRIHHQSSKCAHCSNQIEYKELVRRVLDSVYHVNCFNCVICGRIMNSGEYFVMDGSKLFCQNELRKGSILNMFSDENQEEYRISREPDEATIDSFFIKTKNRRRIEEENRLSVDPRHQDYILFGMHKQKRLRTSFKNHQVRVMRTYFSLNHNPDTKDLKTLSEKTGLSKRVLQVWFQNARAKFRRSGLSKSESNSQTNEDNQDSTLSYSDDGSSLEIISKENDSEDG